MMTNKQYGYWLATIVGAIPGTIGAFGLWAGLQQGRIGPVLVGILFLALAYRIAKVIVDAADKRTD